MLNACVIRPYLLYAVPLHCSHFGLGTLIGKLLADVSFYAMTIPMYEISKRTAGSGSAGKTLGAAG